MYISLIILLIIAVYIDIDQRIIPDQITVTGIIIAIICNGIYALIGAAVGFVALYSIGALGLHIFRRPCMGGGDIKLSAMIGAFLGWQFALLTLFMAPFFGVIWSIIEHYRSGDTTIPYGPCLAAGAIVSMVYGQPLINWIIGGYVCFGC